MPSEKGKHYKGNVMFGDGKQLPSEEQGHQSGEIDVCSRGNENQNLHLVQPGLENHRSLGWKKVQFALIFL